ncbi:MAG: cytidine/deoxycytidylate deaminase family protein [Alphaproteobacteria bacterium]|jgi:dCMP deaminase|nr:cytidine/deoxycytidylate deaminase family protein [Alphaproteobacteria bacterium]
MIDLDEKRPTWDEYFFNLVNAVAKRATCDRGKTACIIVKDKQILATGYVGSSPGEKHCDEVGHLMKTVIHEDGSKSDHCFRTIHAEQNAICQAARQGIALEGATMYCKMSPCRSCAMMIVRCGIKEVKCLKKYKSDGVDILKNAGVDVYFADESVEEY